MSEAPKKVALRRVPDICPECRTSAAIEEDYRRGDRICTNCGFVVGPRVLDEGTEWRTFADEKSNRVNPDRVGAAQSVLFSGDELGTRITGIGAGNTGPLGKDFSSDALERANQRNGMSSADRGLQQAYQEIQFISSKLNIPGNVTFAAQLLYKKVKETGKLNGHHHHFVAAACLYIETRRKQAGRSIKEIAAASSSTHAKLQRNIGRCYTKIRDTMEIVDLEASTEQTYLARFCDKLGFERGVTTICNEVARRAREMGIVDSRQPVSTAGATIFLVAQAVGRPVSANDIAIVSGHTEQTIRSSYVEMYPVRHYLFKESERVTPERVHAAHFWGEPKTHNHLERAKAWAAKSGVVPLQFAPEVDIKPDIKRDPDAVGAAAAAAPVSGASAAVIPSIKREPTQ